MSVTQKGQPHRGCPLIGTANQPNSTRAQIAPRFQLRQPLRQQLLQLHQRRGEAFDSFFQLVVGHAVGGVHAIEGFLIHRNFFDRKIFGRFRIELARQVAFGAFQLTQQLRGNGEKITAGKFLNLADVAEARASMTTVL